VPQKPTALHHSLWHRAAVVQLLRWLLWERNAFPRRQYPVGRILCQYDDCLVSCHCLGQAVWSNPAPYPKPNSLPLCTKQNHPKSPRK